MYSTLCHIKADTAELCASLEPQVGVTTYYEMPFDIVLSLGLTELKAYVCWKEDVSASYRCHPTPHSNWHHDSLGRTNEVEPPIFQELFN